MNNADNSASLTKKLMVWWNVGQLSALFLASQQKVGIGRLGKRLGCMDQERAAIGRRPHPVFISYNRHFRENDTSLQYRRNLSRPKKS
jgi:hypothetical protein